MSDNLDQDPSTEANQATGYSSPRQPMRSVPAKNGKQWITNAMQLFLKESFTWFSMILVFVGILVTFIDLPQIQFLCTIILPVLIAGLMYSCLQIKRDKKIRIVHLFMAFKHHLIPLISIGAFNLIYFEGSSKMMAQ